MRNGITGNPVPDRFPFKSIIDSVGVKYNVSPCLIGAIKMNETGLNADPNELEIGADPATGKLPNGDNAGHGPMQLTSSWPDDWNDPTTNFSYATSNFIAPAWHYWAGQGLNGGDLVRAIAASYNAGLGAAIQAHEGGDVDSCTTDHYGARVLEHYTALSQGIIA